MIGDGRCARQGLSCGAFRRSSGPASGCSCSISARRGALVAALRPLRPGAVVHVHLASDGAKATLRAAVVRCLVAAMDAERMVYHAALRFEETSEWVRERQARLGSDFLEESAPDDRGFENEIPGVELPAALDSESDAKWFEISPEV